MSLRAPARNHRAVWCRFHRAAGAGAGAGRCADQPAQAAPDYIVEKRFAEPVATEGVISATLRRLAAMLIAAMERHGKGARQLEASFFRTDGAVRTIAVETGQPVTKPKSSTACSASGSMRLIDPLDPGFGFDLIRLSASRVEIVVQQQRDLDAHVHDNDELAALIDRIAARIGSQRVIVHLPQDTHIPERAALALPAQQHLAAAMRRPGRRGWRASRRCGRCGCSRGRSRSR